MKKLLSIALSIIMALCVMPAGVAFAGGENNITVGNPVTVTLDHDGDLYILYFTPTRTSTYRIASHTQNTEDPKCDILDSRGELVVSCDDVEGDIRNNNFVITQELQKGEKYTVVCGGNGIKDGITYTVDIVDTTPAKPPASPANLKATDITPKSFKASWDAVDGTVKYVIYDPSTDPVTARETTETEITVSNLTPKTEYVLRVAALSDEGLLSASAQITVKTKAEGAAVPSDVKVTDTTYNSFSVDWSDSHNAVAYKVTVNGGETAVSTEVSESNYTATDLMPNTDYKFTVAALNEDGDASEAVSLDVKTESEPVGEKPEAPTEYNVYARGNAGKSVYLEWKEVPEAEGYKVYIVSGDKHIMKGDVKENRYVFTDLTPSWEYNVMVEAYNQFGSSFSMTVICAAPAPASGLKAAVNSNSITATWNVASCHGYYIQWSTDSSFKTVTGGEFITGSGSTSYTINNIDTSKTYYVRVRTWKIYEGSKLYSDFSEPVKAGTKPSAPSGYNVYGRGNGGKELYLEWNEDKNADGYRVYIVSSNGNKFKGDVKENKFTFIDFTPSWEYNVMVVAYNDYGTTSSKTTVSAAPAAPTGLEAEADGNTINANWDIASCHGYYIQWSTDSSFKNVAGGEFITGSGSTNYTINNIDTSKTYYVRVRTWKIYEGSKLYSDFTSPVTVE